VAVEQEVHRGVRSQERKSVQGLEAAERDVPSLADSLQAERRLVDHLQGQPRLDPHAGLSCPTAEQVPRAQPEMFRDQQPQADHGVSDFVGESLSNAAFDAERIAVRVPNHLAGDLRRDLFGLPARTALREFLFERRIRR